MEDILPIMSKILEYGPLGVINVLLLLKGIPALTKLTSTVDLVNEKIESTNVKVDNLERDIHEMLRDLKVSIDSLHLLIQNHLK